MLQHKRLYKKPLKDKIKFKQYLIPRSILSSNFHEILNLNSITEKQRFCLFISFTHDTLQ